MSTASSKLNFKTAVECKIPLGNLRDVLLSATDLIYNIKCLTVGEGALSYLLVLQKINTM